MPVLTREEARELGRQPALARRGKRKPKGGGALPPN
jgi:hypothetical protein